MKKFNKNQAGFTIIEILLALILIAMIAFIGIYVAQNRNNKKTSTSTVEVAKSTLRTPQEAVSFVQKTYNDYLTAVNTANDNPNNTEPVAQVGLAAVKDNLSASLYSQASADIKAVPFSCTKQFVTNKYTASLQSSDTTTATVAIAIANGDDLTTEGMKAVVDLGTLKITSVTCPN